MDMEVYRKRKPRNVQLNYSTTHYQIKPQT